MKGRNFILLLFFSFILILNLSAFNFSDITLSNDDRLLFKGDFEGQTTLFISRLTDMSIQQLTAFPQKLYLVNDGRTILALNHFGAVKIPASGGLPSPLPGYPSLTQGDIPLRGRLQDIAPSADGRWILHIEPVSAGYGNLLLVDITNGSKQVVSERIELPGSNFPAKWSPDSRLFVYEKGGRLYYLPVLDDMSVLIDERFRMIGSGGINSVLWGQHGDFYYLTGNILYRVISPELFTRTIYGDFLSVGRVVSVLPLDFDSNFDRYWIAPDTGSILINKGTRNLFLFQLNGNRNNSTSSTAAFLPHVTIPYGAENVNVFWPSSGSLTISYSLRNQVTAMRFENNYNTLKTFPYTQGLSPSSPNGILSPDGTRVVFWGDNGLELWDYENWRLIQRLSRDAVFSCLWVNNRQLIFGNSSFIEEINVSSSPYPRRRISLSTVDEFGFEESTRGASRILARVGNEWFVSDGSSNWVTVNNVQLRQVSLSSDRFRVFLERQASGFFNNVPMIRNLQSIGTASIFSGHITNNAFNLGRQNQIALCFDLYDDDTGLPQVLSALRRFNIRATFFLNGEFIRRNPVAVMAIIEDGHETASMFYAPIDFSDTRYRITREFIVQGLARNQDEFNRITGRELSVLWHPPFYRSSPVINEAAAAAGYRTVTRSFDPRDWLSRQDALMLNLRQVPPAEMIDQIIEGKSAGAVVPIRIGLLPGGRDEYLFQRIEVLLDALIRSGYEVVPVSAVIR